jgi:hypothetical protein
MAERRDQLTSGLGSLEREKMIIIFRAQFFIAPATFDGC